MQGVKVCLSLVLVAMRGLAGSSEPLRKAAARAVVALVCQAASPTQQAEPWQRVVKSYLQVSSCK